MSGREVLGLAIWHFLALFT